MVPEAFVEPGMKKQNTHILSALIVFSVLGVVNASYLVYTSFMGIIPTCTLLSGCDLVAASPYSRVFGVPLSLFGVFFYSLVLGFSLWARVDSGVRVSRVLLPLTTLGFLLSLYFLYLQAIVIKAYCQYCLFSLVDASVLFFLAVVLFVREQNTKPGRTDVATPPVVH